MNSGRLINRYADVKKAYFCRLCKQVGKVSIFYKIKRFLNYLRETHQIEVMGIHVPTKVRSSALGEVNA